MQVYYIPVAEDDQQERFIIYRPLLGLALIGNKAMVDLIRQIEHGVEIEMFQSNNPEIHHYLDEIGFFEEERIPGQLMMESYKPTHGVILMTNRCHLRCEYCYADGGAGPAQTINAETAMQVIDQVCENASQNGRGSFKLSFHGGGEPTYPWSLLKELVRYARKKPLKASISITSNGMWSVAQCRWLMKQFDGISLSMDGLPATQDHNRPFANGTGSFIVMGRTLRMMDENDFPYTIRMTARQPFDSLVQDVAYICQHTKCKTMQVEPAFNLERGQHGEASEEGAQTFVAAFLKAYDLARQHGCILRYPGARVEGRTSTTFCSAPYRALITTPAGHLVTCFEVTDEKHPLFGISHVGDVGIDEVIVDHGKLQHLHLMMQERRQTCQDCFCYWVCAGDCYARNYREDPDSHLQHRIRCDINREISKQLILRAAAEGDGLADFRSGRDRQQPRAKQGIG